MHVHPRATRADRAARSRADSVRPHALRRPPSPTAGEWGYSTASIPPNGGPLANETAQAQFLGRMVLSNIGAGVNASVWYDWRDDGDNASYIEDRFGVVRRDYANESMLFLRKPAAFAAAAVVRGLAACDYVGTLNTTVGGVRCFALYLDCGFQTPGFAAWCAAPEGWSTTLTFPYDWAPTAAIVAGGDGASLAPAPGDGVGASGPCYRSADYLGTVTGLPCATGTPPMWSLSVSSGITYLRDVW